LAPKDSGYNIARREKPQKEKYRKQTPLFALVIDTVPSGITHLRDFQFLLQPLQIRLDATFWQDVGYILNDWSSKWSVTAGDDQAATQQYVNDLRTSGIAIPVTSSSSQLAYIETLQVSPIILELEFLMQANQQKRVDCEGGDVLEDEGQDKDWQTSAQSAWISNLTYKLSKSSGPLVKMTRKTLVGVQYAGGWLMASFGSALVSGAGHIKPTLKFPEQKLINEFGDLNLLTGRIVKSYAKSGATQLYKVFLSTNLLGDPIGLVNTVGGGFTQFFKKTGDEIMSGELKGEGVKQLTQGVVGGMSGHAGKFLGALGDTVDAAAHTGGQSTSTGSVEHVGDGLTAGLKVFGMSTLSGVTGLVSRPLEGFKNRGMVGLGQGMVAGVTGVVAKPLSGALHGVQKVAEGVDATTHLWDHVKNIQPRRAARPFRKTGGVLDPLVGLEFFPKITVFIDRINMNCLEKCQGNTYTIEMFLNGKRVSRSKIGRLTQSAVIFEESHWVPTDNFLFHDLEIQVKDRALSEDKDKDQSMVFKAKIPTTGPGSVIPDLASILRHPPHGALTSRFRPAEPTKLHLVSTGGATQGCNAELLLRFWPAWDPESLPSYLRYSEAPATIVEIRRERAATNMQKAPPRRMAGIVEKRAKGIINHWAAKYVVVENHEFKYWDDKKHADRAQPPKVRIKLTSKESFRFAAGDEKECFVQVATHERRNDGQIEAKWRPCPSSGGPSAAHVKEWLGAIFEHYINQDC